MLSFDGRYAFPSNGDIRETVERSIMWGRIEIQENFIADRVISGAARDAGGSPTTLLRPGLLMGEITATRKLVEWTPGATDGSERIFGVLLVDVLAQMQGTNQDRWGGLTLMGGNVRASGICVPGNASAGISGDALESYIRAQMAGRFWFDDMMDNANNDLGWSLIKSVTANTVLTKEDNGTWFNTLGNAGALQFTLPAVAANKGMRFKFSNSVDQNMTVASAAANGLITFNNAAASSVAFSTAGNKIGGTFVATGLNGAKWQIEHIGANTMTVA